MFRTLKKKKLKRCYRARLGRLRKFRPRSYSSMFLHHINILYHIRADTVVTELLSFYRGLHVRATYIQIIEDVLYIVDLRMWFLIPKCNSISISVQL